MSEYMNEVEGLKFTEFICDKCLEQPKKVYYTKSELHSHMQEVHEIKRRVEFRAEVGGMNGECKERGE